MAKSQKASKKAGSTRRAGSSKSVRGKSALTCPDCGFVAAHPMGLGRHRSSRHGVVSKRQMMRRSGGGWLTRQEAAKRAGVHYNTIRQWERSGAVRTKRDGRAILIDERDLSRARGGGQLNEADAAAALARLQDFYAELTSGLQRLLDAAEASRQAISAKDAGGRGAKKAAAKKSGGARKPAKRGRGARARRR